MNILIINGPNLNLLGIREPDIYGSDTYENLCQHIEAFCKKEDIEVSIYQSNHEGDIVDKIQSAYQVYDGIVINPAAYTHTSLAIPEAIKAVAIPTVEVHLTNIDKREDFRKKSYMADACLLTFKGEGFKGYNRAITFLKNYISDSKSGS